MKTTREYISEIKVVGPNLEHISKTGKINGSLMLSIEHVMIDYAKEKCKQFAQSVGIRIIPKVQQLEEQNKELIEMLQMICMDLEERGRAYGDAYNMAKQLLTKYK